MDINLKEKIETEALSSGDLKEKIEMEALPKGNLKEKIEMEPLPSGDPKEKIETEALPSGWLERVDKKSGKKYYVNTVFKLTQWERPTHEAKATAIPKDLPEGWTGKVDQKSGRVYYVNSVSRTTTWKKPTKPAVEDLPTEASKGGVGHNTTLSPKSNKESNSKDSSEGGSLIVVEIEYEKLKQKAEEKQKGMSNQNHDDFEAKIPDSEEQKRKDIEAKRRRDDKFAKLEVKIPHSNPGFTEICPCSVL